jgi:hypothetical protein
MYLEGNEQRKEEMEGGRTYFKGGRKDGRTGGRKDGRTEGRAEGRTNSKEGRMARTDVKERRREGRTDFKE